ncbi:hypothetical protein F4780DRAFT_537049 [Xylariomycetidae sp. FL0641]|nr:hypothetical protein F4780DRAFT_537049 [Xylariomycetidae sp. FL0641]
MASGARPRRIKQSEWNDHREAILGLFLDEEMKLSEIVELMKERHAFEATKNQYEGQLRRWKIKRNIKDDVYLRLIKRIDRIRPGIQKRIMHHDRCIDHKVRRARKRLKAQLDAAVDIASDVDPTDPIIEIRRPDDTWGQLGDGLEGQALVSSTPRHVPEGLELPVVQRQADVQDHCQLMQDPNTASHPPGITLSPSPAETWTAALEGAGDGDFGWDPEIPAVCSPYPGVIFETPPLEWLPNPGTPTSLSRVLSGGAVEHSTNQQVSSSSTSIFPLTTLRGLGSEAPISPFDLLRMLTFAGFADRLGSRVSESVKSSTGTMGRTLLPATLGRFLWRTGNNLTESARVDPRSLVRHLCAFIPGEMSGDSDTQADALLAGADIDVTKVLRFLLFSMMNGNIGLEEIPTDEILKIFTSYTGVSSLVIAFLKSERGRSSQAFAEALYKAAMRAKLVRLVGDLISTDLIQLDRMSFLDDRSRLRTPFQMAIILRCPDLAQTLLDAGADADLHRGQYIPGSIPWPMYALRQKILDGEDERVTVDWLQTLLLVQKVQSKIGRCTIEGQAIPDPRDCMIRAVAWGLWTSDALRFGIPLLDWEDHEVLIGAGFMSLLVDLLDESEAIEIAQNMQQACGERCREPCLRTYDVWACEATGKAIQRGFMHFVDLTLPHCLSEHGVCILATAIQHDRSEVIEGVMTEVFENAEKTYESKFPSHFIGKEVYTSHCWKRGPAVPDPLSEAISASKWPLVLRLESAGAIKDDYQQCLALWAALRAGELEYSMKILEMLETIRFFPKTMGPVHTAMLSALQNGETRLIFALLDAGVRGDIALLNEAITQRNVSLVEDIFYHGILREDEPNDPRLMALVHDTFMKAAQWGNKLVIDAMLHEFRSPYNSNRHHQEPFSIPFAGILEQGDQHTFNVLLELVPPSKEELSQCLEVAIRGDNLLMVKELLQLGADPFDEVTLECAANVHPTMLKALLDRVRLQRRAVVYCFGCRAMTAAIRKSPQLECLGILLNSGIVDKDRAYVDRRDMYRWTNYDEGYVSSLAAAITYEGRYMGWTTCPATELLLKAGCDANILWESCYGRTLSAFVHAIELKMNSSLIQLFIRHGANVNSNDIFGTSLTPLQTAVEHSTPEIVKLLLDNGADVNAMATSGFFPTPLQMASEHSTLEIVKMLLDKGADVDAAPARTGETALQKAARKGNCNVAAALLHRGADLYAQPYRYCRDRTCNKAKGEYTRWPLESAAENGRFHMIEFLWKAMLSTPCTDGRETGFEEEHCRYAMKLAESKGYIACSDLIGDLMRGKAVDELPD